MKRWDPPVARSEREERLLKLAGKSRKLLVFLRERRHEIFDAGFQAELESMYRGTDQGEEPQPPALMSVALLLQGYLQVSDAEAVRLSATDLCWRLVLGTLNRRGDEPAFSQGGLQQFRDRMIRHDMDRRLLERTIEVAKTSRAFDWRSIAALWPGPGGLRTPSTCSVMPVARSPSAWRYGSRRPSKRCVARRVLRCSSAPVSRRRWTSIGMMPTPSKRLSRGSACNSTASPRG